MVEDGWLAVRRGSAIRFPQDPNQHRPQRPVLLAIDQQLAEGAALRVAQNSPIRSARSKWGA
jgi:hypothetical protein